MEFECNVDKTYTYLDFDKTEVRFKNLEFPLIINVLLTDACNLKCVFCSIDNVNNIQMDKELCLRILDEAKINGVLGIAYSGGEPLLYNKYNLLEVLKYGRSLKIKQTLTTNAVILNKKDIINFSGLIDGINISLHGDKQMHNFLTDRDVYDKVLENIFTIKKTTDLSITLLYTATLHNSDEKNIRSVAELSKKVNGRMLVARGNLVGRCKLNSNGPTLKNINDIARIVSTLKSEGYNIGFSNCVPACILDIQNRHLSKACSAGISYCAIDPIGNVKICAESPMSIGKLDDKTLISDIWQTEKMKEYRNLGWMSAMCKSCKDFYHCKGGRKVEEDESLFGTDSLLKCKVESALQNIMYRRVSLNVNIFKETQEEILLYGSPSLRLPLLYKVIFEDIIDGKLFTNEIIEKNISDCLNRKEIEYFLADMFFKGIIA